MDKIELRGAVDDLSAGAEQWLVERFGTAQAFRHGFGYHNRDHGRDVASAAERIASKLHEARRVPWETVLLAPYAGWRHDAEQGEGHERRSARIAAAEMRERDIPERHIATVQKMIEATKVRIDGYRIVQVADPGDAEEALLADADLSHLGRRGVYRGLLFGLEVQHRSGLITLPSRTDGLQVEPDRDEAIKFLRAQVSLYANHQFLLDVSRELFPHQEANRDQLALMLERYEANRISYCEMLADAKRGAVS